MTTCEHLWQARIVGKTIQSMIKAAEAGRSDLDRGKTLDVPPRRTSDALLLSRLGCSR